MTAKMLHNAIMNLPHPTQMWKQSSAERKAYSLGHRDARHAAAELALQRVAQLEAVLAAARELITNIRDRYPDEGFYCPYMRKLDEALKDCF